MPGYRNNKYNSWSPKLRNRRMRRADCRRLTGQTAEITVGPGGSTRFFAEMRNFFPFREGLIDSGTPNLFIVRQLIFGIHFTILGA